MSATIRKTRVGRVIIAAGLRKDGNASFEALSDWRDGGSVVIAFVTPWVVVTIFDGPRLDVIAADFADEDSCSGEEGEAFDPETGTWVPVTL